LPTAARVSLKVNGLLGQEVASLVEEEKQAGEHSVQFSGENLASCVYFYRLQVHPSDPSLRSGQGFVETKKFLLLR
jgi:hypothetical protein